MFVPWQYLPGSRALIPYPLEFRTQSSIIRPRTELHMGRRRLPADSIRNLG